MRYNTLDLADFGWSTHFQSQLDPEYLESLIPVRVLAVHRNAIDVAGPGGAMQIPPFNRDGKQDESATVGDWLLVDRQTHNVIRILERKSVFKRKAAGTARRVQLIAANVDKLFIVSSCNQDFNIARLERYLALAREAEVMAVVVLTKADLASDTDEFTSQASRLMPGLLVEAVDARDQESVSCLEAWCGRGQTIAFVGSSGVGKSTLINTLSGKNEQDTQAIREDDAKGRHTTTGRSLHRLAAGGWLLDTPGMRELQLADAATGIEDVFADVVAIAGDCRFSDCRHEMEPGCAVRAAIERGDLDAGRLKRFRKLVAEELRNSESIAERRARSKDFGKMARRVQKEKRSRHQDH